MEDLPKDPNIAGMLVVLVCKTIRGKIMRNSFCAAALILLSGCVGLYMYVGGYTYSGGWGTPSPYYRNSNLNPTDTAEQKHLMQPCVDHARQTFPEAALRFEAGLPRKTTLAVVTRPSRADGTPYHVLVEVGSIIGTQINGRKRDAGVIEVDGRSYDRGDNYSLATTDIVDWTIEYPDQPEEGNWLKKYLLLRQDGLVSGPCDPLHSEFQHSRFFGYEYSLVPPSGPQWHMRGGHVVKEYDFDMFMQELGDSPHEVNTLSAAQYFDLKTPLYETDQELVISSEVIAYTELGAKCTLSHRLHEDGEARLSSSGERGPMIREIMELGCLHPSQSKLTVQLTYSHRYQDGYRDPEFVDKANRVFQSLAFTELSLLPVNTYF
jgi:hypothetical protein